jgi:hypothetical protein
MGLKDNERLMEAIDSLKSHIEDKDDGPLGAIGFALDENDADQIEKACDELIDRAIRVRLAAFPEELEDANRDGPRIVLVSGNGYWSAGATFWQAMRRLPCLPDIIYLTDDSEPTIYNDGAIGVRQDTTLVKIPVYRDGKGKIHPIAFIHKPHTTQKPKDNT